jgi:UDP-N-acetylmuramoyl-tripeptide--D-alanyl-D-alanine ligase
MKQTIQKLLARISKAVLNKYKPTVIGVTGSVGKTSTRQAIFAVVCQKFNARTNIKNYNNEFGLPFTILDLESPKRNLFKWLGVFLRALKLMYSHQQYPEVLVLEMGIDKPGDMDYLTAIARPDIAVLTSVGISHLKYFKTPDTVLREKKKIFKNFEKNNTAVINFDDQKAMTLVSELSSSIITYGLNPGANVQILSHRTIYSTSQKVYGTEFELSLKGQIIQVFLPSRVGLPHARSCAAGAAVGMALGMSSADIQNGLQKYHSQPGRMFVVHGKHHSLIIDDTYNSAPDSARAAIQELAEFPGGHKIAVLGDMLELGSLSEESHREIGEYIAKHSIDYVVLVGPESRATAKALKQKGYHSDQVLWFNKSTEAISSLQNLLGQNHKSIVLIKGSQGMRMEKIVKDIMSDPSQAFRLLCRQDSSWLKK